MTNNNIALILHSVYFFTKICNFLETIANATPHVAAAVAAVAAAVAAAAAAAAAAAVVVIVAVRMRHGWF